MDLRQRISFFVDVDNTLLDNDSAKGEMDRRMRVLIGSERTAEFWHVYEDVRAELTMVDIPMTLARMGERLQDRTLRFLLADLFMRFPFASYLYSGTDATIAHLRSLGSVAIVSDGDAIYQTAKIVRSGLAAAVGGYAHVYEHKEDHLNELIGAFPADHYVLIDDKPRVIERVRARLHEPLTTIFVRQGHYASEAALGADDWSGADLTFATIAELKSLTLDAIFAAGASEPHDVSQ